MSECATVLRVEILRGGERKEFGMEKKNGEKKHRENS